MSAQSVVLDSVSFAWPDGREVLASASATFAGRTGLVGRNGVGKSTLLRLIAGELKPTSGRIQVAGQLGVLPQRLSWQSQATVAELLGIGPAVTALRSIEAGSVSADDYETVGVDWDVEARALAALSSAGLADLGLDLEVGKISGGQAMLAAVVGLRLAGPEVVLLDEPTNNLDRESKDALLELLADWPGRLIVVSHDLDLLNSLDETVELLAGQLTCFGGPYWAYAEHVAQAQASAKQAVATAKQQLRVEQRQRIEAETRLARRARVGRKNVANSRFIGAAADERRRRAQQSAGKTRGKLDDRVSKAEAQYAQASNRLRRDEAIGIDMPEPELASTRRLVELRGPGFSYLMAGPERVALTGRNGVGKTRLLETLWQPDPEASVGAMLLTDRCGYLPQRLLSENDSDEVLSSVRQSAPGVTVAQLRARLAHFRLGAEAIQRRIDTLSGGERFRVALARILLADPPPQLVVLDEPTNNLDLVTIAELVSALNDYRGGLLVVSHDQRFLAQLGIHTWLELVAAGDHRTVLRRGDPAGIGG